MRVTYIGYDPCSPILSAIVRRPDVAVQRVVTSAEPWGEQIRAIANKHGLPLVLERARKADLAAFAADSDLLICACYDFRLALPSGTACVFVNVHPTLLPLGRGPTPVQWILLEQPESAGVTLHLMTDQIDEGPIIAQAPLPEATGHGYETYMHCANQAAVSLLARLDLSRLSPRNQVSSSGSYNPTMPPEDRTITPAMTGAAIVRLASIMGPLGARVSIDDASFLVSRAEAVGGSPPGDEAFVNWLYAYYPCADGYCIFPRDGLRPA